MKNTRRESLLTPMDNILSWNIKGLNNRSKQHDVKNFILSHNIRLFNLLETKVKSHNMGDLYLSLCPGWWFSNNSAWHKNGRTVIVRHPTTFHVNIEFCNAQIIHTKVEVVNGGKKFNWSFVYGYNERKDTKKLWESFGMLSTTVNGDWVILGDFNAIMNLEERIGQPVRENEVSDMRSCMGRCCLVDVKSTGKFFTWNNKQEGVNRVYCKPNRVVGNVAWMEEFAMSEVMFLLEGDFDHCPILLKSFPFTQKRKPFRFFDMWGRSEHFLEVVRRGWQRQITGTKMFRVVRKLKWLK